ncbi:hypothetical protein D3OALGA1CA_4093 [Olavius algarvensis associated proteobacterium Delta 3]|nr:hypothetical protein D3OALGA1CA_4093 [Olavius algarvensis associated proteobacterium Delta 3]
MEENRDKVSIEQRNRLSAARQEVLGLTPEKIIQRILKEPHPAALVHSFPEEDFYFLVHGIGPTDVGALLKLASDRQWEYVVDQDIWRSDRIQMPSVTRWLNLLTHADPQRLASWAFEEKFELLKLYLYHTIELKVREHDQDPSEFGKGFPTFDDVYYFRVLPEPAGSKDNEEPGLDRENIVTRFLDHMSEFDHLRFQTLLLEADRILPAEAEEEMFRQRNMRLAERGFLPYDEAIGIYQPIQPEDLKRQSQKVLHRDTDPIMELQLPQVPADMLEEDNLFTRGLRAISSEDILYQLQAEFAGLCNQLLSADQLQVRDRKQLNATVQKAGRYIHIGLESLIAESEGRYAWSRAAQLIEQYPLIQLFRVGFGRVLALKWRAERWRRNSWFEAAGLPLSFWDEAGVGLLGGLFLKQPLFFDDTASGQRYRAFRSEAEIQLTTRQLDGIIAFDGLFSSMEVHIDFKPGQFLTYKKLILTLWARHYLGIDVVGEPTSSDPRLSLEEFGEFFQDLFPFLSEADLHHRKRIGEPMKSSFLEWVSQRSGMEQEVISETLGIFLESVFRELEDELGDVPRKDLDPRFISLFLLQPEGEPDGSDGSG